MKITILGCSGSQGVPRIGCSCYVCSSPDIRDKRSRTSALIEIDNKNILIDCGPDFKNQAIHNNINTIDAVFYTHMHADHICGTAELKEFGKQIPIYVHQNDVAQFGNAFGFAIHKLEELYKPFLKLNAYNAFDEIDILGQKFKTIEQDHGNNASYGLVGQGIAYCTDVRALPEESIQALYEIDILVLDCFKLYYSPSHFSLEECMMLIERIKPKFTILTHMSHDATWQEYRRILPANVIPGYDGLTIET